MQGHGIEKFKDANLIATSERRSWTAISAELRSHQRGEIGAFTPQNAEITMIVRAGPPAVSSRASGGVRQDVRALPGTTWLCPAGIREEATRLSDDIPEVLHVYIPQHSFLLRNRDEGLAFAAHDLRYEADVRSPVIRSLLDQVIGELRHETASGGQRMDSLAGELIAVLAGGHAEAHGERRAARRTASLDRRRLARVLDHIEDRLGEAVSVSELAAVACMSLFHFTRAFSAAMGRPPHAYLSERRLDRARHLLAHDGGTLAGIALVCGFSSQANFSKAFRRATGVSPGAYRLGRRD